MIQIIPYFAAAITLLFGIGFFFSIQEMNKKGKGF